MAEDLWDQEKGKQDFDERCLHCSGTDHLSQHCPKKPNSVTCFSCNQPGHVKSECPNPPRNHRAYENRPKEARPERPSHIEPIICTKCGGKGHRKNVCPSNIVEAVPVNQQQRSAQEPSQANREPLATSKAPSSSDTHRKSAKSSKKKRQGIVTEPIQVSERDVINRNKVGENFDRYSTLNVRISDDTFERLKLESFDDANLDGALMDVVRKCKYEEPTPIQSYGIPVVKAGRDLLAICETGSGKTAAYLLPVLDLLISLSESNPSRRGPGQTPLAVIVAPTRELVEQLVRDGKQFARRSQIEIKECYGGTDFLQEKRNIERGTQLLIGTTGRIKHFVEEGTIKFDKLRVLVLDEADEMLRDNFRDDVSLILSKVKDASPQVLMFSATFPKEVLEVAERVLRKQFVKIEIGVVGCAIVNKDIRQVVIETGEGEKLDTMLRLIESQLAEDDKAKIIAFVERRTRAEWLRKELTNAGVSCSSIHSDRTQVERQEAMRNFQNGDNPVLVATSVAGRGLDITSVTLVINYDLPQRIEDYINRLGRTGRLGNLGLSIAFFDPAKDRSVAHELRNCLVDAGEEVPDFLDNI